MQARAMLIGVDASRAVAAQMTGTEVYSRNLIRELVQLHSHVRYRLYFREVPPANLAPMSSNIESRIIRLPGLWTHLGLSWEVTRYPPDLLFIPAHVVPAVRRCPTVVTIHDVGYLDHRDAYPRTRWWYLHLSTLFSVRVAALVITDSHATKAELGARYGIGADKIRVVHLACDPSFAPVESPQVLSGVRARYGIHADYFLFLGTLQPRKNIAGLLAAFAEFKAWTGSKHKLVLAGRKGWLYEAIYDMLRKLQLSNDVIFAGYVPDQDLPALISGAIALVFPSFHEGFGLPALQAMSCGTPVIASNVSSLPEVVGDAGLLADPYDPSKLAQAMATVASDGFLRRELRRRGLERARRFSWAKCAAETFKVFEEVVGRASS